MKLQKSASVLKSNFSNEEHRINVFAKPSARKSYERLFEIAKLNFQSLDSSKQINQLLWES